jgi:Icc-related predicted phosphoesterase
VLSRQSVPIAVAVAVVCAVVVALSPLSACAAEKPVVKAPPPPPAPPPPDHPRTWAEVPEWYGSRCPPPTFSLDEPLEKNVAGAVWTVHGSTAVRDGRWSGPLAIGVLGAIKDASDATRQNLVKAKAAFDKARVDVIVANGDVAETAEIHDVAAMLGELFGDERPFFVHSGNSEWTGGFTEAFADVEKAHPAFFNLNLIRDVDLGGVHLLSLPGWSVKQFVKEGGCRYGNDDVAALGERAAAIAEKGELVVLTAHGPPRGPDAKSLDRTHDFGNVGDEALAALLQTGTIRFGIFGHILEAGGRATADATTHRPLPLPMKKTSPSLFVNVGSASSVGIQMLDKRTSRGLAAIVVVDDIGTGGRAKVTFVPLRR